MAEKLLSRLVKKPKTVPYEKANEVSPLVLLIIIVPQGQALSIKKALDDYDTSAAFVASGEGTGIGERKDVLGLTNKKNIIFTIVRVDKVEPLKRRLKERFSVSRASAGVAITIRLTSVAGVSVYKFLSNTRKVNKV